VHYSYGVDLSGRIAAEGSRMLDGAARVLIGAFFEALARRARGAGGDAQTTGDAGWWKKLLGMLGLHAGGQQ